ncbi:MAG: hypothetical protein QM504_08915 [Pseudomonadota bacterium]
MKWEKWLENWDMTSLKIKAPFLDMTWSPQEKDKDAAWELYIELLTRVSTQALPPADGDEATALESIHSLFQITREVIKNHGRDCFEFSKIAIVVLNQVIRPFTAKWHKLLLDGSFEDKENCVLFRNDLCNLQIKLRIYTRMLGDMAGVESDLTEIEQ